jgi:predicted secreted protein
MKYAHALFVVSALLNPASGRVAEHGSTLPADTSAGHEVVVTGENAERKVPLKPGDILVVRLRANPSTGYAWYTVLSPTSLIESSGYSYIPDLPILPGSGGVEEFRFKPRSAAKGRTFERHEWFRMLSLRSFEPGVSGGTLWEIEIVE